MEIKTLGQPIKTSVGSLLWNSVQQCMEYCTVLVVLGISYRISRALLENILHATAVDVVSQGREGEPVHYKKIS